MIAFSRRVAVVFAIILAFQFYNPACIRIYAGSPDEKLQNTGVVKAVVKDKFAFAVTGAAGLFVIDIQNPANPRQAACLDLPEAVSSIGIYGNHAYLPALRNVYIVDITEPLHPSYLRQLPILSDEPSVGVAAASDLMFLANTKNIMVFSLTDPANPVFTGSFSPGGPDGSFRISDIAVRDGTVYITGKEKGVRAYSFAEVNTMIGKGQYPQPAAAKKEEEPEDKNKKTAYITIDDGPSGSITPTNLDTLKKYGIKATFFVLPRNGVDDIYKRILDEGHVIGNHSYSHDYTYLYNSTENFKKDVIKARDFVYEKTGYTSTVFRFPGGTMGRSKDVIKARAGILDDLGYKYFDWDVSTADTDSNLKTYGTEEYIVNLLTNNVIKNTKDRKKLIILMHDSSGKTYSAKALPKIIEGLQKQGYEFDVLTNY